jgi:hypothetical protein
MHVGWLADGELYLEPEASFAAVQRFARDQNESFAVTAQTLRRRLKEKGLLAATDAARGKLTVRRTLQGARRDVLHITWTVALSAPATGPIGPEGEAGGENGPETWAGSWAGNSRANGEPAHNTAAAGTSRHAPATVRPERGRLGRSDTGEDGTAGANNLKLRAAGLRPPVGARRYYQDTRGRPCTWAEAASWTWEGGPRWFDAATDPPPSWEGDA